MEEVIDGLAKQLYKLGRATVLELKSSERCGQKVFYVETISKIRCTVILILPESSTTLRVIDT